MKNREVGQLKRLETLMDVVFGITLWRIFMLLPRPAAGEHLRIGSVRELILSNTHVLGVVLVGILIVIVYWVQNNTLFGNLERSNNRHTAISILQMFSILFMLYAIGVGVQFEGDRGARILESLGAFLVGATSIGGWRYAVSEGLVRRDLPEEEVKAISEKSMAEPLTAAITIPFAFIGPVFWDLSWFFYPVIRWIVKRRRKRDGE